MKPLQPGATIGILGGGQLGRMLVLAASRLGFKTHIYSPSETDPAKQVAYAATTADYNDSQSLNAFARSVDVVTYEFENIPVAAAVQISTQTALFPSVEALHAAQDRLNEKTFISEKAGVPVAPFHPVNNEYDIKRAQKKIGEKLVLKTRRMGYDGKGQRIITDKNDAGSAFKDLGGVPCVAESFIPFKREVSVVCARGLTTDIAIYPLIENVHQNHILFQSIAPATGDESKATIHATKILEALDYIGVLAVEFFEMEDGRLIVNEIAPRVHNSGHWTMDAGCIDQFELHIRAISGWPLGNVEPKQRVRMTNLLGEDIHKISEYASNPNIRVHHYGKSEARVGRKMGHINEVFPLT